MTRLLALALVLAPLAMPRPALAWEWFRSENDHVAEGNELLAAGDHAGALREYDLAARELPSEPAVHLDRGLALLAMGEYGRAREALVMAAEPPASAEIRGMAHYNIGLSYYLEGDAASRGAATAAPAPAPGGPLGALGGILGGGGAPPPSAAPAPAEPDHARARNLFREAADAFRDSLRQVPGNRDAGWNLELALRRITEEEEAEREEREREEEEESESEESEESESSESCDNPSEGEDGEPSENGGEGEEESESEEGENGEETEPGEPGEEESESNDTGEEESESGDEEGEPGEDGAEDGASESEAEGREEEGDASSTHGTDDGAAGSEDGEGSEVEAGGTTDRSLPPDMERVLDALETGEENLSAARARARGSAERRRVERDW